MQITLPLPQAPIQFRTSHIGWHDKHRDKDADIREHTECNPLNMLSNFKNMIRNMFIIKLPFKSGQCSPAFMRIKIPHTSGRHKSSTALSWCRL
mmetsp:Transcript_60495/g.157183  ORF Transcript_60495/g.157183 Transcript_60495/m.157183 type:complete len:94 (+) Transcript_60495:630-911(+)